MKKVREAVDSSLQKAEKTVQQAGCVVTATAILSGAAILLAFIALVVATRR